MDRAGAGVVLTRRPGMVHVGCDRCGELVTMMWADFKKRNAAAEELLDAFGEVEAERALPHLCMRCAGSPLLEFIEAARRGVLC